MCSQRFDFQKAKQKDNDKWDTRTCEKCGGYMEYDIYHWVWFCPKCGFNDVK